MDVSKETNQNNNKKEDSLSYFSKIEIFLCFLCILAM